MRKLTLAGAAALVAAPLLLQLLEQDFYVGLASRIMIYAIAATSLNLILGYGGMVSFGHAAFLGAGAYTVGILMAEGVTSAWIAWPAAVGIAALFALVIGAISLRTRGVYFIMITLAFAQIMYYIFVSLKAYGGEDGLNLATRSGVGFGLDLKNDLTFYYVSSWPAGRQPSMLDTNRPGVLAVGDVRSGSIKRVASAVGEGSMAVRLIHEHLAWTGRSAGQ